MTDTFQIFSIELQDYSTFPFRWKPLISRWDRRTIYGVRHGFAIRCGYWHIIVLGKFKQTRPVPYSIEWWNQQKGLDHGR